MEAQSRSQLGKKAQVNYRLHGLTPSGRPRRYGYHRMLIKRFPFAAYYEIYGSVARVVAILNMRRNPKSIRALLTERRSQSGA